MSALSAEARKPRVIREVMILAPYSVQQDHPLVIAVKMMREKHIRHLPVFEKRKLIGVLGERDLLNAINSDDSQASTVAAAVKSAPLVASPDELLRDVVKRMVAARADVACVVDRDRLVGVFTTIDALKVLAEVLEADAGPEH